jgi:hypothetical protein
MPYQVEVAEPLLRPLASQVRTRVWLALARVAQVVDRMPAQRLRDVEAVALGEGYSASYRVDIGTRTVSLLGIEHRAEPQPQPHT